MTSASRPVILALVLCGVLFTVTAGGVAGIAPADDTPRAAAGVPSDALGVLQDGAADTNESANGTPRHRNPDAYGEDGDLAGVESWLEGFMASRLGDSAIQLSEGQYDVANDYLGEEYRDRFGQYVDVAGETEGDNEEQTTAFDQARNEQETLAESTEQYRETRTEYEDARQAGDDERARELARELERLASDVDETSSQVRDHYETIENTTGVDLGEPNRAIQTVNEEIQAEQATIRDAEFRETELTLSADTEAISFSDPLRATGLLQTADGEPIANETIRLDIGDRTQQVETNASGAFTLQYQPVSVPLNTSELGVEYIPATQSVYLGTVTTIPVSIEQETPTINLAETPDTLAYGDSTTVTGAITVNGTSVDDVPLVLAVDGHRLGTVRTHNGGFAGQSQIPAAVADGERTLTVRLPFADQALAGVTETAPVMVTETTTTMTVNGQASDGSIAVNGTLTTVDGAGVAGEPVDIRVDGSTVTTVTTGGDGTFETTLTVADEATGDIRIAAVYTGQGTNLAPAEAATTVTLSSTTEGFGPGGTDPRDLEPADFVPDSALLPLWAWVALGSTLMAALGIALWWRRRTHPEENAVASPDDDTSGGPNASAASPDVTQSVLAHAAEDLAHGRTDDAVRTGYGAVRQALSEQLNNAATLTHWEFYRRYQDGNTGGSMRGVHDDSDSLRIVTAGYERAAFDPDGIGSEDAATVLARARQLCGLEETGDTPVPADD